MELDINKKVNELTNELKKCHGKDMFARLIKTFYVIDVICEHSNIQVEYPEKLSYELVKYSTDEIEKTSEKGKTENFFDMLEYNAMFSSIYEQLVEDYMIFFAKFEKEVNIGESIKLVRDFFDQYDSEIFKYYMELIKSERIILTNKTERGSTVEGSHLIRPYSFINIDGTVKDSITIVHETIHNYLFDKQRFMKEKDNCMRKINNVDEVYPSFIELVFMDYLNGFGHIKDDVNLYKKVNDSTLVHFLKSLSENISSGDLSEFDKNEAYSYGKVLAYHFYNQYLEDKETAKKNILDFSLRSHEMDKMQLLNSYGLISDKLLDYKVLTRHMRKHNEYK